MVRKIVYAFVVLVAGTLVVGCGDSNALTGPDSNTGRNPKQGGIFSHSVISPRDPQSGLPTGQ